MSSFNLVRCKKCGKIVGADHQIKEVEHCYRCHRGQRKKKSTIKTAGSAFARTKKGPAEDLGSAGKQNFRSGWERNFARWLSTSTSNWTYERHSFTFTINPKTKKPYTRKPFVYIMDFYDGDKDIYYEVKGYFRSEDRSKIKRLKANYPEEFKKLVVVISKSNKKAKSFYSKFRIPILFIEDLKKEYESRVTKSNWEGR